MWRKEDGLFFLRRLKVNVDGIFFIWGFRMEDLGRYICMVLLNEVIVKVIFIMVFIVGKFFF